MRAVVFTLLCACGASAQPAVMPNLATMPEDGETKDHIIDSSFIQPSAEQQPTTKHGRKVETAAATWAAILGMMFSKTDNADLALRLEENDVVTHSKHPRVPVRGAGSGDGEHKDGSGDAARDQPAPPAKELVPWIRLGP